MRSDVDEHLSSGNFFLLKAKCKFLFYEFINFPQKNPLELHQSTYACIVYGKYLNFKSQTIKFSILSHL